MKDYKKIYYEQSPLWTKDFKETPAEKERIQEVINIIPSDVQSILDVGCGNGAFINCLIGRYKTLVGLDLSKEALKYVKTEKIRGNITSLLFKDESFDLVTCLETLEHLSQEDFEKESTELQRVSKKYIIITVPNQEDIEHSLVMCPKCYCWFNPYFHMRSFNRDKLQHLFKNFKLIKFNEIGPLSKKYSYPSIFLTFYRNWEKPLPPSTAICPQCGYRAMENKESLLRRPGNKPLLQKIILAFIRFLAKAIWPPKEKKRWLLALYQK